MAPLIRSKAYDNGWKYVIWVSNTLVFLIISRQYLIPGYFEDNEFVMYLLFSIGASIIGRIMNKKVALEEGDDHKSSDW